MVWTLQWICVGAPGQAVLSSGLLGYVLPGATRTWELDPALVIPGGDLALETQINGQSATLPISRAP